MRAESQSMQEGPLCLDLDAKPKMPFESGGAWYLGRLAVNTGPQFAKEKGGR